MREYSRRFAKGCGLRHGLVLGLLRRLRGGIGMGDHRTLSFHYSDTWQLVIQHRDHHCYLFNGVPNPGDPEPGLAGHSPEAGRVVARHGQSANGVGGARTHVGRRDQGRRSGVRRNQGEGRAEGQGACATNKQWRSCNLSTAVLRFTTLTLHLRGHGMADIKLVSPQNGRPPVNGPATDSKEATWRRASQVAVIGLFVIAVLWCAYAAQHVIVPLLLAWVDRNRCAAHCQRAAKTRLPPSVGSRRRDTRAYLRHRRTSVPAVGAAYLLARAGHLCQRIAAREAGELHATIGPTAGTAERIERHRLGGPGPAP